MRFFYLLLVFVCGLLPLAASAQQYNPALLASTCAACHGTDGKSQGGTPRLAGLDKLYFIKQMHEFQSGKRDSTVMKAIASGYTDKEIKLMARYFAKQRG